MSAPDSSLQPSTRLPRRAALSPLTRSLPSDFECSARIPRCSAKLKSQALRDRTESPRQLAAPCEYVRPHLGGRTRTHPARTAARYQVGARQLIGCCISRDRPARQGPVNALGLLPFRDSDRWPPKLHMDEIDETVARADLEIGGRTGRDPIQHARRRVTGFSARRWYDSRVECVSRRRPSWPRCGRLPSAKNPHSQLGHQGSQLKAAAPGSTMQRDIRAGGSEVSSQ